MRLDAALYPEEIALGSYETMKVGCLEDGLWLRPSTAVIENLLNEVLEHVPIS
jgi:hypothetical protein